MEGVTTGTGGLAETAGAVDLLLTRAPVGIALVDQDQRYVRVNEALAQINGIPADEHVGRSAADVVPDLAATIAARVSRVLATGEPLLDQLESRRLPASGGEERSLSVSYYPVVTEDGVVAGVGVIVVDVTDRRRAEVERMRLERITEAGLAHLAVPDLLDELLARLADLLEADTVAIFLLDAGAGLLVRRACRGLEHDLRPVPVPVGAGFAGVVAQTRAPRILDETKGAELVNLALRARGIRSLVGVPLLVAGRLLGVLRAGSLQPGRFTGDDVRLLELVADRMALAIDQASLFEAEREANAAAQAARLRLELLAEASEQLTSTLDEDDALERLATLVVRRFADVCAVHRAGEDGRIRTVALVHRDPARGERLRRVLREHPYDPASPESVPYVIRTGRGRLFRDVSTARVRRLVAERPEHEELLRLLEGSAAVNVPIAAREGVLGVLSFVSTDGGRRYDDDDLAFAQELGRRIAVALDTMRLYRQAEERGRAARILESVGDGVFLVDGDDVVRYWNAAAARITGLPVEAVLDRRAADAIPGWDAIAPLVPVGRPPQSIPLQLERETWVSIAGVALEDGTAYAFRDLTEERALEELRADFVSTASHELRTPLAAIYGAAVTLLRADVRLDEAQRGELLAIVAGESERLARIVNDILWTSRLDAGTVQVFIESCDASALAESVVAAQRTHLPPALELDLVRDSSLPLIAADADKVRQVLTNLLDNAVKYSPDGGRISVTVSTRGTHVRFAVADEGLGIPHAEQRRIFDKFYRLDPNLTRGVGGTGLGLYIVRELVRRMDGRIRVRSQPGRGSTFVVELPVAGGSEDTGLTPG